MGLDHADMRDHMTPDKFLPRHKGTVSRRTCACGCLPAWSIGKLLCASGQVKYPWFCVECGRRTNLYEPVHPYLIFTRIFEERGEAFCERCGMPGAELHHWMPRHLSPSDCEKWPVGFLCQPCHARWHRVVTPGMGS